MIKLGYGLSKLPLNSDGTINKDESYKLITSAINSGIDIFDTAPFYLNGQSEEREKFINNYGVK